ncbi:zona pellucida sperm-binding protein 4-like [Ranitomeya variabilis]|uniref:zona pellucida sperm-binding protein 4-like n=1 Tax=Ranitomeya variabilis TaxID=490064 RepID=UPI0040566D7F
MVELAWCRCLLLLYYCTLLWSAEEGSWSARPTHIPGLVCDSVGFHYTVYPKWNWHISMKLTAFDRQGGAHALSAQNDCGTWIIRRESGAVALHAFYNGCYVYEENDEHVMTILVEKEYSPGNWTFVQIKTLKCPKLRVTIQCSQDELISVISKAFTRPQLKLDSVRLIMGEATCKPVLKNNGFLMFNLSTCGTTHKEVDGTAIYETVLLANIDLKTNNTSTKTSLPIRLHIQCSLGSSDVSTTEPTNALIPSPLPSDVPKPLMLQMRLAKEKMTMYKAAGNGTALVSSQGPLYFPNGASGKGSPALPRLLAEKWERIVLVVGVLAALLSIWIIKRRCKKLNDKAVSGIQQ